ncbi:aminoglycoside phosphotransferase family protein [Alicyclobacillus vulcanalis]|uniref:Ser/Thr protein kinase RdoA involved in Cpx stress response, MazF antagonist n=1 Tax=Alicyclobacillus vulcanalis TaxID=252246 RepID=A0A1N7P9K7_9BACL|nr:aminoglycoside phosphotransferase family protein [Alicyclobacillus vulcanalis]SIT07283.1 Ser/Thr protein kinase RdoA involved in Cpx stress response, MazF antagonist [Alicyclobacillus vulcanalis]
MDDVGLAKLVRDAYGIEVDAVVQKRTVWGVVSGNARYILKRARPQDSEARLEALARVLKQCERVGVASAGPLKTVQNTFCAADAQGTKYYLQPWLDGRHVDVREEEERLAVARALARAQRAMLGDPPRELCTSTLRDKWRAKLLLIERLQSAPVDAEIAQSLRDVAARARQVYQAYLEDGPRRPAFCHRDLAPHNVLVGPGRNIAFIDFDHAGYDDPFADPIQWVSHVAFLVPLDPIAYRRLWLAYAQAAELSEAGLAALVRLGAWPDMALRALAEALRAGSPESRMWRVRYALRREEDRLRMHDAWLRELNA